MLLLATSRGQAPRAAIIPLPRQPRDNKPEPIAPKELNLVSTSNTSEPKLSSRVARKERPVGGQLQTVGDGIFHLQVRQDRRQRWKGTGGPVAADTEESDMTSLEEKARAEAEAKKKAEEEQKAKAMAEASDDEGINVKRMDLWWEAKLSKFRSVVLVFFPGTWCPWSRKYLVWVNKTLVPRVTELGGKVYGVTTYAADLSAFTEELGLDYRLIADPWCLLAGKFRVHLSETSWLPESCQDQEEHYPRGLFSQCGLVWRDKNTIFYNWSTTPRKLSDKQKEWVKKRKLDIGEDLVSRIWHPDPAEYPTNILQSVISMHTAPTAHKPDAGRMSCDDLGQEHTRPHPDEVWRVGLRLLKMAEELESRNLSLRVREGLCMKRLMKDVRECYTSPLPYVVGRPPYENNIREWHCNITSTHGEYQGIVFHLKLEFPVDYPTQAPTLTMLTPIPHPNVFGKRLCLDMLWNYGEDEERERYRGWSSGYTAQSILIQLQSFLFDGAFKRYEGPANQLTWWQKWHNAWIDSTKKEARKAKCECGHRGRHPMPDFPDHYDIHRTTDRSMLLKHRKNLEKGDALKQSQEKLNTARNRMVQRAQQVAKQQPGAVAASVTSSTSSSSSSAPSSSSSSSSSSSTEPTVSSVPGDATTEATTPVVVAECPTTSLPAEPLVPASAALLATVSTAVSPRPQQDASDDEEASDTDDDEDDDDFPDIDDEDWEDAGAAEVKEEKKEQQEAVETKEDDAAASVDDEIEHSGLFGNISIDDDYVSLDSAAANESQSSVEQQNVSTATQETAASQAESNAQAVQTGAQKEDEEAAASRSSQMRSVVSALYSSVASFFGETKRASSPTPASADASFNATSGPAIRGAITTPPRGSTLSAAAPAFIPFANLSDDAVALTPEEQHRAAVLAERKERKAVKKLERRQARSKGAVPTDDGWKPKPLTDRELKNIVGRDLEGIVTRVQGWGVFIDVGAKKEAILHVSQVSSSMFVDDCTELFEVGQRLRVRALSYDATHRHLQLTMKDRKTKKKTPAVTSAVPAIASSSASSSTSSSASASASAEAASALSSFVVVPLTSTPSLQSVSSVSSSSSEEQWVVLPKDAVPLSSSSSSSTSVVPAAQNTETKRGGLASPPIPTSTAATSTGAVAASSSSSSSSTVVRVPAPTKAVAASFPSSESFTDAVLAFLEEKDQAAQPPAQPSFSDVRSGMFNLLTKTSGHGRPLTEVHVGDIAKGIVTSTTSLGAFVDFGAVKDGLLHINTMIKAYRPRHIWEASEVLKRGVSITVRVTQVDRENGLVRLDIVLSDAQKKENERLAYRTDMSSVQRRLAQWERGQHERRFLHRSPLGRLDEDILRNILSFIPLKDVIKVGKTCDYFQRLLDEAVTNVWIKEELICFHSRRTFAEDTLGFGLRLEYYRDGELAYIHPLMDLVSKGAIVDEKVHHSVWNERFTHWLPLYLSSQHAKNMLLHEKCLTLICTPKETGRARNFSPHMVLKVFPALLNTMVVAVMKGATHESLVALSGYCAIFQLFVAFVRKYPELQRIVDKKIKLFVRSEISRNKHNCPNLGEFVAFLAVSNYSWEDVAMPVLKEAFDRNAKWVFEKHPELCDIEKFVPSMEFTPEVEDILARWGIEPPVRFEDRWLGQRGLRERKAIERQKKLEGFDRGRIQKTWNVTLVSTRLLLFHVYFLRTFRGRGADGKLINLEQAQALLDKSFGRPDVALQNEFQREVKRIKEIRTYKEFFTRMGLTNPKDDYLCEWLQNAVRNSARKKYHDGEVFARARAAKKEEQRKKAEARRLAQMDRDELGLQELGVSQHQSRGIERAIDGASRSSKGRW